MALVLDGSAGVSGVDGTASNPSYEGTDSNTGIFFPAADTIAFAEGGAEVARFDSSGRWLVGTTTAIGSWGSAKSQELQIAASGAAYPGLSAYAFSTNTGAGGMINLGRSRSTTVGTIAATQSSDVLGYLIFEGANSSNALTGGGYIDVVQTAAAGANYIPAAMRFFTSDTTNGPIERARITSGGDLLLNTTTLDGGFTCNKTASFAGNIYPAVDNNGWNCGTSSKRWSTIFAVTGTINTSDARLKTEVRSLQDAEISAAQQLAYEIGSYKWLSAIEQKGTAARHHIGMTVQRAIEIMETNGLSPFAYGFICFDQWDEVISEDGVKVQEAGNSYSFRIDELGLFIARGQQSAIKEQQAMIDEMKAEIAALKAQP